MRDSNETTLEELRTHIEVHRYLLHRAYEEGGSLLSEEVNKLPVELDHLIVEYVKLVHQLHEHQPLNKSEVSS